MSDIVERLKSAPTYYGEETVLLDDAIAEIEKLRAALKLIAETYNKPTTSKDGLAFTAAAALKETNNA